MRAILIAALAAALLFAGCDQSEKEAPPEAAISGPSFAGGCTPPASTFVLNHAEWATGGGGGEATLRLFYEADWELAPSSISAVSAFVQDIHAGESETMHLHLTTFFVQPIYSDWYTYEPPCGAGHNGKLIIFFSGIRHMRDSFVTPYFDADFTMGVSSSAFPCGTGQFVTTANLTEVPFANSSIQGCY